MEYLNKVTNGDCLEVLRALPENSVDLVVTDPPYGIDFKSNSSKNKEYRENLKTVSGILNDGGDNTPFLAEVIEELARVMKDGSHIYWFTRWDRVYLQMPELMKYFTMKNAIVWDKCSGSMGDLHGAYSGSYELVLFAQKGRRLLNEVDGKKRHSDIIRLPKVAAAKLRHSHEKPEDLIEFFIKKSSNEGEIVLDAFCGSGTTAAVAQRLDRQFITSELDPELYQIAKKRVHGSAA